MKRINFKELQNFDTFDEHIAYLEKEIKENEEVIKDCQKENEEYRQEIEEVKLEKKKMEEHPETYEPTIYLGGWADTDEKKQKVIEWAQQHELVHHPELVRNFAPGTKLKYSHQPTYEFITASSNTNVIRYVRCVDCYEKALESGKVNKEDFEKYLK